MKLFELIGILSQLNESIDIHGLAKLHQGNPEFDNAVKSYRSTLQGRKKELLKPFGLDDLDKFKSNPDEFVKMVGYAVDSFKEKKDQKALYVKVYEDEKCLITMPKGPKGAAAAGSFCKEGEKVRCPWCICVKYPENEKWWKRYGASAVFFVYAKKNGVGFDACCIVMSWKDGLNTLKGRLSYSELEGIENRGLSGNPEAQRKVLERLYSETGLSDSRLLKILHSALEPIRQKLESRKDEEQLLVVAEEGNIEMVRKYLQAGFDADVYNECKETPLHLAAREGHLEICKLLINAGADVGADNKFEQTPLLLAAYRGYLEICKILLKTGANVNTEDQDGDTPLYSAAEKGHLEICKLLINAGADVNGSEDAGETILHTTASNGHLEICKLLIDAGADVNAKSYGHEWTPLFCAVQNGHLEICKMLLKAGANVNINVRNLHNETPLSKARDKGFKEIAELLIKAGAQE